MKHNSEDNANKCIFTYKNCVFIGVEHNKRKIF